MKGQQAFDSNFSWWGKRDYVHGSHMIYQLLDAMKSWGYFDVERIEASFRYKLREQGTYIILDGSSPKTAKENYCATFKAQCRGRAYWVALIGSGKPVEKFLPDDENDLIANCTIIKDRKVAGIKNFPITRYINVIIALNKRLLHETIRSEGYEHWYMAQLSLDLRQFETGEPKVLSIRLENVIANRMTKSSIEMNNVKLGEIFFNRKPLA